MPTSPTITKPASLLKPVRLLHRYLGVFIAPALLFFAFTGAIQTFSLHETTRGSSYQPPRILVLLAQIHKKQTSVIPGRKPQLPPDAGAGAKSPDHPPAPKPSSAPTPDPSSGHNPLPLKIFFLIVSVGLFLSTLTGLYMSYKYAGNKVAVSITLLLGAAIPLLLLLF